MFKFSENGDVDCEGWERTTPDGSPVVILVSKANQDTQIVLACQRLEDGEPWKALILECPHMGGPAEFSGTIEYGNDSTPVWVGLEQDVNAYLQTT